MTEEIRGKFHIDWIRAAIVSLIILLVAMLLWFASDVHNLYKQGVIRPAISRVSRRQHMAPTIVPAQIQGWMTFNYINYVFNLPSQYLLLDLNISNPKYLNLSLDDYSKDAKIKDTTFIQSVKDAVSAYRGSNP